MPQEAESLPWKILYRNGTVISILCFVISILLLMSGWMGWLNIFNDEPKSWFQRSGSIMTVVLLFADYHLLKMNADLRVSTNTPITALDIKDKFRPYITVFAYLAITLTVLAAVIWGYGDIIYQEFKGIN